MNWLEKEFKALVVEEKADGSFGMSVQQRQVKDLPEGDVLVRVAYSSLNYKDALSANGNRGVTKQYPHTPGIDAAGEVVESSDARFKAGDMVIVSGYDLGMNTDGGYGQFIRVPGDWVVMLPEGLGPDEAMVYGTAGFTAALSVHNLVAHVRPEDGEVLVTGATGGVGSTAVALLANLGYTVVGVSGKKDAEPFLKKLGVSRVIGREEVLDDSTRPLLKGVWAGAVETVGGKMLEDVLRSVGLYSAVTCCGNAGGFKLDMTVYPFILRGVRLIGISAQSTPMEERVQVWKRLAAEWKLACLNDIRETVSLEMLANNIALILQAGQKGRVVVDLNA